MKILRLSTIVFLMLALFSPFLGVANAQDAPYMNLPRIPDPVPSLTDKRDVLSLSELKEEVLRRYPRVRFDGSLDLQNISAPADPAKRFEYTIAMMDLVSAWVALDLGSTLLKALEGQVTEKKDDVAYLCTYAHFAMIYPAFSPSTTVSVAEKTIARALEVEATFAPANYLKALYYYIIVIPNNLASKTSALDTSISALASARAAQPTYAEAMYLEAEIEQIERKNYGRAAELLRKLLEGSDLAPPTYVKALRAYRFAADKEADAFLKNLLEHAQTPIRTALLKRDLAEAAYRKEQFEDCMALANDALKHLSEPSYAVQAHALRLEVIVNARKRMVTAAAKASKENPDDPALSEKLADLRTAAEKLFAEVVDLDISTLSPLDERKTDAAFFYAAFAVEMGDKRRALEILRDYDRRAAPLNRLQRAEVRRRMGDLEAEVEKTINLVMLKELADAANWLGLAAELAKYERIEARDPGSLPLTSDDTVKLLTGLAGSTDRLVAAGSMLLLAHAATNYSETARAEVVSAIAKRSLQDAAAATPEQRALLKDALYALSFFGGKDSLAAILDVLEVAAERLDQDATFRSDFLTYIKSASDCATMVQGEKADYGRRDYTSTASAKAWIVKIRDKSK